MTAKMKIFNGVEGINWVLAKAARQGGQRGVPPPWRCPSPAVNDHGLLMITRTLRPRRGLIGFSVVTPDVTIVTAPGGGTGVL